MDLNEMIKESRLRLPEPVSIEHILQGRVATVEQVDATVLDLYIKNQRLQRKLAKAQRDRTEAHSLAAVAIKGMRDGYYRSVWEREREWRQRTERDLKQANHSLGIYKQRAERAEATLSVLLPMLGLEDRAKEIADALLAKALEVSGYGR